MNSSSEREAQKITNWRRQQKKRVFLGYKTTLLWQYYRLKSKIRDLFQVGEPMYSQYVPLPSEEFCSSHSFFKQMKHGATRKRLWIFPSVPWYGIHQRPQQLAQALASMGIEIYYVEPSFFIGETDIHKANIEARISHVVASLPKEQSFYTQILSNEDAKRLASIFAWAKDDAVLVEHPFWQPLFTFWQPKHLMYDCIDELEGFALHAPDVKEREELLAAQAQSVVVTHPYLQKKLNRFHPILIPNAADADFFAQSTKRSPLIAIKKPKILYYGMLDIWFDRSLLAFLARAMPNFEFILVGPVADPRIWSLARYPNVLFTGKVAYTDLPSYLHDSDVCILPFLNIPLTKNTNPVKLYEILAAGKPFVATNLPGLDILAQAGTIELARNKQEWVEKIRQSYATKDDLLLQKKRKMFAQNNTWQQRAKQLKNILYDS